MAIETAANTGMGAVSKTLASIHPAVPTIVGVAIVGYGAYYVYKRFIKKDGAEADTSS